MEVFYAINQGTEIELRKNFCDGLPVAVFESGDAFLCLQFIEDTLRVVVGQTRQGLAEVLKCC